MASKLALDLNGRILALAVNVSRPRTGAMPNPAGSVAMAR